VKDSTSVYRAACWLDGFFFVLAEERGDARGSDHSEKRNSNDKVMHEVDLLSESLGPVNMLRVAGRGGGLNPTMAKEGGLTGLEE